MSRISTIRATKHMAKEIAYIQATSWQAAYRGIIPDANLDEFTPKKRTGIIRKSIATSGQTYFLLCVDFNPIGMIVLGKARDMDAQKDTGEVLAIYLLPDYWGAGYGYQMLDFAMKWLQNEGYRLVFVWALQENSRARAFYERFGFVLDVKTDTIEIGKPLIMVRYRYAISARA